MSFYYEDILSSQNYIAKSNVAWSADFTSFELARGKKVYVFICIYIFTNRIIGAMFRTKTFTNSDIITNLEKAIEKRIAIKAQREVIMQNDKESQFTSD